MYMLYIRNDSNNPYYNLALEEYVLKNLDHAESYILLWQNEPSVIIGRFQNTIEEINQDYIEQHKVNVVRRITGGGAVYHDLGNLNFSFVVGDDQTEIDFRRFTEPVVKALAKIGIQAEHTGQNDITIDGKKFSGNAQFHFKNRTLHHGTILFNSQLENVQAALKVKADKIESKGVKSVRSRVTNIIEYLDQKISVLEFKEVLLHHLFEGHPFEEYTLSEEDRDNIEQLMEQKYMTWEWNYGRSPEFNLTKTARFPFGGIEFHFQVQKGIIETCRIYGDFFTNEDVNELAEQFKGVRYREEDLKAMLERIDLNRYFTGLTGDDLLEVLV